jgi:hypothetical protein
MYVTPGNLRDHYAAPSGANTWAFVFELNSMGRFRLALSGHYVSLRFGRFCFSRKQPMRQVNKKRELSARTRKIQNLALRFVRKTADFFEKNPDRWTTGVNARDKKGEQTAYSGRSAHCFCMHGKLRREFERAMDDQPLDIREDTWRLMTTTIYAAINRNGKAYMSTYNDRKGRTVDQVVGKLRAAEVRIEKLFD